MAEESVLLVGKVIGIVKKGLFEISLLLHVKNDELNYMGLFDVMIFAVDKENYIRTIYNSSHPCTGIIWEDASLDGNDQGVSYGLIEAIHNDFDFENLEKLSQHLSLKKKMRMNKISHKREKKG